MILYVSSSRINHNHMILYSIKSTRPNTYGSACAMTILMYSYIDFNIIYIYIYIYIIIYIPVGVKNEIEIE